MKTSLVFLMLVVLFSCSKDVQQIAINPLTNYPSDVESYLPNETGELVTIGSSEKGMRFIKKGDVYTIGDMKFNVNRIRQFDNYLKGGKT